ncbi:multidrug resistance efflux pump [Alteromonadaceae bacterium 2753L.S.0a.02]|nr:multidrug resistance efflux pump [Alteromonadaceae bacterium 2753L.S.0a.02]
MSDVQPESVNVKPVTEKMNPIQKWTLWVLLVAAVYFVWYLFADRITPSSSQARVRGYIVPMAAQITGEIVKVHTAINQKIAAGEAILEISKRDYELAVDKARADLEKAGQDVGANSAAVISAQAALAAAQANFKSISANAARVFEMEKRGILPNSDGDKARGMLGQAEAQVEAATAELERAHQNLGNTGSDNVRVRVAAAALQDALLDLERTVVRAPADGVVSNMKLDVGQYARTGEPLFTFVSTRAVWVEAFMRENNLGNIKPGNQVDIVLDAAPGRIFKGEVINVGVGVKWDQSSRPGELPVVSNPSGWMRDAQRFPVVIQFNDDRALGFRREGGQADVVVYTSSNLVLNILAKLDIILTSWFTYLN